MRQVSVLLLVLCLWIVVGCVTESKDAAKRDVAGPYQTWDDVIKRWVGGQVTDLYVETLSAPSGPAPTYIDMLRHDTTLITSALK